MSTLLDILRLLSIPAAGFLTALALALFDRFWQGTPMPSIQALTTSGVGIALVLWGAAAFLRRR